MRPCYSRTNLIVPFMELNVPMGGLRARVRVHDPPVGGGEGINCCNGPPIAPA